mmetsp:Transcript_43206/g.99611  ORF Transcript_43206/g.99611 Transcript_43206/m.99611 type:complete len:730 (+) Transcript_43206:74-2263(+)
MASRGTMGMRSSPQVLPHNQVQPTQPDSPHSPTITRLSWSEKALNDVLSPTVRLPSPPQSVNGGFAAPLPMARAPSPSPTPSVSGLVLPPPLAGRSASPTPSAGGGLSGVAAGPSNFLDEVESLRLHLEESVMRHLHTQDMLVQEFSMRLTAMNELYTLTNKDGEALVASRDADEDFRDAPPPRGGSEPGVASNPSGISRTVTGVVKSRHGKSQTSTNKTKRFGATRRDQFPVTYLLQTHPTFKGVKDLRFAQGLAHFGDKMMTWREPQRNGRLAKLLRHPMFGLLSTLVVIANTVEVIISTNQAIKEQDVSAASTVVVDLVFLLYYSMELLIRFRVHGIHFFHNDDWKWNWFDFAIVIGGYADFLINTLYKGSSVDLKFLRASRFLRVTKVLRTFRILHWCRELGLVLRMVQQAGRTMLFVAIVMLLTKTIVAVIMVQGYINHLDSIDWQVDEEFLAAVQRRFGTVQKAALTLFQCLSGGTHWEDIYLLLQESGDFQQAILVCYIFSYNLVFFHIVTSIFVEKGKDLAQVDHEQSMMEKRRRDEGLVESLYDLLAWCVESRGLDMQNLTRKVFQDVLADHDVMEFFEDHQLDSQEALLFFDVLTSKLPEPVVSVDMIAEGCVKLKGAATSLDLLTVMFDVQALSARQKMEYDLLHTKLDMVMRNGTMVALFNKNNGKAYDDPYEQRSRTTSPTITKDVWNDASRSAAARPTVSYDLAELKVKGGRVLV